MLLALTYALILSLYRFGWGRLPAWVPVEQSAADLPSVTVIIAARNEAAHIGGTLASLLASDYPAERLEIIVVDDHSGDGTAALVRAVFAQAASSGFALRLLSLSEGEGHGKKHALEQGLAQARGAVICATDADCIVKPNWVRLMAGALAEAAVAGPHQSTGPVLVTAPVLFHREQNWFQRFQSLDVVGLMGITGAGIHLGFQRMANGANMAYVKSVFDAVGGYTGNASIASGDDMFLVQKVAKRFPNRVMFLKHQEAAVLTLPERDWPAFWRQRVRWGSKNAALPEWPVRLVLLAVFLFCWNILFLIIILFINILYPIGGPSPWILATALGTKALFDYLFLKDLCNFFARPDLLRVFWPAFVLHTLYIPLVGLKGLLSKGYTWKGRRQGR